MSLMASMIKKLNKLKKNNRGSSIVLVIIAIAFVGTLATILVYATYYNYLMKHTDRSAKGNFYTAETALNEINAGLQQIVSTAMQESYAYTMQNGVDLDSAQKQKLFSVQYKANVLKQLKDVTPAPGATTDLYDLALIQSYLKLTKKSGTVGAEILTPEIDCVLSTNVNALEGYTLKNVKVKYTDPQGYVSIIATDIKLVVPALSFASTVAVPEIENFSLIANNNLVVPNKSTGVDVIGSVYGGQEGIKVTGNSNLTFTKDSADTSTNAMRIIAANVYASDGHRAANSAPTLDSITMSSDYQLWSKNVNVKSAAVSLLGQSYIRDDLNVEGNYAKVVLGGSYYGYGKSVDNTATGSSSILINGGHTTLDFSKLTSLSLAGHSYVGARHYNVNESDDFIEDLGDDGLTVTGNSVAPTVSSNTLAFPKNDTDILTGQSLAIKSDQLLYMVPLECMGYDSFSGEQVLAKNPLSYQEYEMLAKTPSTTPKKDSNGVIMKDGLGNTIYENQYKQVRSDVIMSKIGNSLDYYGASYKTVFRKVNGTILVYYYLYFQSEALANQFFFDYYQKDSAEVTEYIKTYIKSFKWNSTLGSGTGNKLSLAGNMITYTNSGKIELKKDTSIVDNANYDAIVLEREKLADNYNALYKKLITDFAALSSEEIASDMYTNLIVDNTTFKGIVPSGKVVFGASPLTAIAVNNTLSDVYEITSSDAATAGLVVVKGNVLVNADFEGLIIAGGDITIGPLCNNITYDPAKVRKCMGLSNGSFFMSDLFDDGAAYANYKSGAVSGNAVDDSIAREADYIKIPDLIEYHNWQKE